MRITVVLENWKKYNFLCFRGFGMFGVKISTQKLNKSSSYNLDVVSSCTPDIITTRLKYIFVYCIWTLNKSCKHRLIKHYSLPFAASWYRSLSFHLSWNWNIFTGTNTLSSNHAEFKSEKFPLRRPAVFSQTAINFIFTNFTTTFFIVQRHGSMTTNDYVTQKEQFLLTSLPFNKRRVLLESDFELCYIMRVGTTLGRYI
jgi:hypothetical protein